MVGSTLAIDQYKMNGVKANLQAAVDNAVLSTVSNGTLKMNDRQPYAEARFHSNYSAHPATLTYSDTQDIVRMTARAEIPTIMGGIVGRDRMIISASAAGTLNRGRTICTLALAPDGPERLTFKDSVYFTAKNCSVQVNSTDPKAIVNMSTMTPKAQDFCVTGGGTGKFKPKLNSECTPVADPYANLVLPEPQACRQMNDFEIVEVLPGNPGGRDDDDDELDDEFGDEFDDEFDDDDSPLASITTTLTGELPTRTITDPLATTRRLEVLTGSNRTIEPGNYCDGLTIDGVNITFPPGVYHFGKDVKFKNGAQAYAKDVTFILYGSEGKIKVESGAELYMKAPSDGMTAGLAIVQDVKLSDPGDISLAGLVQEASNEQVIEEPLIPIQSELKSGGRLDVIGTVYLPQQELNVSGTSVFGARSKSTSFIAYEIHFSGKTRANIAVNHQAEGLPPVQPRSEESPRLIQ